MRIKPLAAVAALLVAGPALADPFLSSPGVRARGMGGAFVAVADDASAVWHNPAGLADLGQAAAGEWLQAAELDAAGDAEAGANAYLLGAWRTGHGAPQGPTTAGIFYYTPYTLKFEIADSLQADTVYGQISETVQQLSLAYGMSLGEQLQVGFTLDRFTMDTGGTGLTVRDTLNVPTAATVDDASSSGLGISVGGIYRLQRDPAARLRLSLGAVYRTPLSGGEVGGSSDAAEAYLGNAPTSYDLGAAVRTRLGPGELLLAAQYGALDWGRDNGYRKLSSGAEYRLAGDGLGRYQPALRLGWYRSTPADGEAAEAWPEVSSISFGLGFDPVAQLRLELFGERLSLSRDGESGAGQLFGLGGRYVF